MTEPSEKKATKPTSYTVLREVAADPGSPSNPPEPHYVVLDTVDASSATAARQRAFDRMPPEQQGGEGHVLVAIPTRSWVPKRRQLATQPKSVEV